MQLFNADTKIFLKFKKKKILSTKSWKNHPKKLLTHGSWEVFFSAAPPAQNSPELHFRFISFSMQLSLLESLVYTLRIHLLTWFQYRPSCQQDWQAGLALREARMAGQREHLLVGQLFLLPLWLGVMLAGQSEYSSTVGSGIPKRHSSSISLYYVLPTNFSYLGFFLPDLLPCDPLLKMAQFFRKF